MRRNLVAFLIRLKRVLISNIGARAYNAGERRVFFTALRLTVCTLILTLLLCFCILDVYFL